jgi:hypothetical protein
MIRKSNMTNDEKAHLKDGLKMSKKVQCAYKQKIIGASGKCYPKTINEHKKIEMPEMY